jgi:hypothetical protein
MHLTLFTAITLAIPSVRFPVLAIRPMTESSGRVTFSKPCSFAFSKISGFSARIVLPVIIPVTVWLSVTSVV